MIDDSQDERLLGAVASALVAIDELRGLTTFQMPYPPTIQRTLDRTYLILDEREVVTCGFGTTT